MSENTLKKGSRFVTLLPFLIFVSISLILYLYVTPEKIVSFVGADNAYILMFVTALIGGLTTFNGVPYFSVLLVLASGGLNPFFLGLTSAVGVMLGDSTSYYIGYKGGEIISSRIQGLSNAVRKTMEKYPRAFPVLCFIYGSVSPLSNDFITISSGIARYPFFRVMIPLALGNLVFNITLAFIGGYY